MKKEEEPIISSLLLSSMAPTSKTSIPDYNEEEKLKLWGFVEANQGKGQKKGGCWGPRD